MVRSATYTQPVRPQFHAVEQESQPKYSTHGIVGSPPLDCSPHSTAAPHDIDIDLDTPYRRLASVSTCPSAFRVRDLVEMPGALATRGEFRGNNRRTIAPSLQWNQGVQGLLKHEHEPRREPSDAGLVHFSFVYLFSLLLSCAIIHSAQPSPFHLVSSLPSPPIPSLLTPLFACTAC
ncbi:hypothetical protein DFH06DRAFT_602263 [Mycena polygramma]|nr:hypothetical protein DFH06DRAFT_602263 [Mycena polygramma]